MGAGDVPAGVDHDHQRTADRKRRDDTCCAGYDGAANSEDEEKSADKFREPSARRIHARIESDSILSDQPSFLLRLGGQVAVTDDEIAIREPACHSSLVTLLAAGVFGVAFTQLLNDLVRFGGLAGLLVGSRRFL